MIYLFGFQKEAADIRSPTSMAEQKTCSKEGQKKLAEKTHVGASFLHEKKSGFTKNAETEPCSHQTGATITCPNGRTTSCREYMSGCL